MSRPSEKEIVLTVIEFYKDMPFLWDKGHSQYMNREKRTEGFRVLLEIYKKYDANATPQFVFCFCIKVETNFNKFSNWASPILK